MSFMKLIVVVAAIFIATTIAKDESSKARDKRQQVAFYPRRGGRPPPYAVQMEPIVQYSQRDPLYNPLASSKSDDLYEEAPLSYYPTEPEPIIEIIIKESNESLPTPVPPPPLPPPRPTKEPVQVFYVKYEKKKGYGDKSRVIYDPPVPALTPVEEHEEEIKPDNPAPYPEEPVHTVTPAPPEPSTTLRAIIRPDSEVYHSGSSGIRVTFGTDQVPPNNHNKRSDVEAPTSKQQAKPSSTPPGSPKRQHGPYQPIQPVHQRVLPAFPQQRVVNPFPQQQPLHQPLQQQQPLNFLQQQTQFSPSPQTRNPLQRPQRLPITIQGLPDVQQRAPFSNFGPSHRVNINHPQQPGFPPTLSVSHQNVQIQNQPGPLNQGNHFNAEQQQQQQPLPPHKQQELEKQRYHEQRRQQDHLKQREHQRQHEQHRLQEHQRFLERQRQVDQQRQVEQQRLLEQQRQQEQQRLQEHQRLQEQQRIQEQQRVQEHQRLQDQRRRKQEQDQKLFQEQQYRSQFKYNQAPSVPNISQIPITPQSTKPGGEIFKAVPKLEQHYAIRENPLHPGPFPPNPSVIQPTGFSDASQNQYVSAQPPSSSADILRNSQSEIINDQQQYLNTKQQILQNQQQGYFSQALQLQQQPQQQQQQQQQPRFPSSSQRSSIWGRPSFGGNNANPSQKIYATPVSPSEDFNSISTNRPYISSTSTTTTTTTTTTTEAPTTTTTISPKNEARIRQNIANLPDEVPDDIREQLLSSGILGNADIQILDYDKVGGIPIEKLPPEALANFYGAGGASAVAASEPVPSIVKKPKTAESASSSTSSSSTSSAVLAKKAAAGSSTKFEQATLRPGGVEMKVVRFDPNTEQGQALAHQHIRDDATRLNPVTVGERDESQYNRYLPLKVSGASFPIPDVPQLNGRKISSVVVLAPVDSNFQEEKEIESRQGRRVSDVQAVKFLAGDVLKQLVKKPTTENYKKWLEQESRTEPQKQSVVLLVTMPKATEQGDKEIFMYDVASKTVSKLAGDLSTAFVDAAETNSDNTDSFHDSNGPSF